MNSDVIIIGGGLVGMTLALALDKHGLSSVVVDSADLSTTLAPGFDGRASAIASASARMFKAIGLWDLVDGQACAIDEIRVTDGLSPLHLHFDARDADLGPLGYMVENRLLRAALIEAAAKAAHIKVRAPARYQSVERTATGATVTLHDGTILKAPLVIAADGRRSALREAAGIRASAWRYGQTAIVTMIEHEQSHGNVAFELFYPTGPFAILPMRATGDAAPGTRSAIVWSVENEDAPAMLALPERALAAEVAKRMGGFLGDVKLIAPASSYPLGFHHAERYTDTRLALIGDAAHGIHPIAGQGFNMGLRDVAALAEVLVDGARLGLDLGDAQLLARYEGWRRFDNMMVASVTDALNRLFAVKGRPAAAVRRLGLAAVERIPPLKRFFMAEARGETGDLPKLLQGLTV
ncbi:UbiH/UbiF/VisC/COQ6 family ubiquinone biosynthesis hydroxylase [Sphingoaurantiacus capsulatus]|uniref:UbiH/UbiF/VisC/COQ6 family ubiquinone biosynthesis hydroxylase n=1 Tax=Sphingoaurantiacus capsulatus TaxID=1771310 RepID=A0ABV7XGU0_9SPHN